MNAPLTTTHHGRTVLIAIGSIASFLGIHTGQAAPKGPVEPPVTTGPGVGPLTLANRALLPSGKGIPSSGLGAGSQSKSAATASGTDMASRISSELKAIIDRFFRADEPVETIDTLIFGSPGTVAAGSGDEGGLLWSNASTKARSNDPIASVVRHAPAIAYWDDPAFPEPTGHFFQDTGRGSVANFGLGSPQSTNGARITAVPASPVIAVDNNTSQVLTVAGGTSSAPNGSASITSAGSSFFDAAGVAGVTLGLARGGTQTINGVPNWNWAAIIGPPESDDDDDGDDDDSKGGKGGKAGGNANTANGTTTSDRARATGGTVVIQNDNPEILTGAQIADNAGLVFGIDAVNPSGRPQAADTRPISGGLLQADGDGGGSATANGLGQLTLSASSTLDHGTESAYALTFPASASLGQTLTFLDFADTTTAQGSNLGGRIINISATVVVVPEPTGLLTGLLCLGLAAMRRRR